MAAEMDGLRINPNGPLNIDFETLMTRVVGLQPGMAGGHGRSYIQFVGEGIDSMDAMAMATQSQMETLIKTVRGLPNRAPINIARAP